MKEISIKDVFKTLTLFFVLSLISVIMVYAKFEQGVEDFWENNEKYKEVISNSELYSIIDLDNADLQGDVYEFDPNKLVNQYIESGGEVNVFKKIFEEKIN